MINIEEKASSKIPGSSSLYVNFKYDPKIVEVLRDLSCKYYDEESKTWEVPLSCCSYLIDNLCTVDDINLKFIDYKEDISKEYKLAAYKTKPFNYQLEAIQFGLNHDKWLLLDEPGLGKSLTAIYLAEELKRYKGIKHCLIICGINNLKFNWKKEIEKHSTSSCVILGQRINKKGKLVIGSVKDRVNHLLNTIDEFFIITNIETLREEAIVKAFKKTKNKIDMIIVDEIHACKSPTSQQGKHLLKLDKAKFKVGMTGTLLLNNPLDTYMPLKWIDVEKAPFSMFKGNYCSYGGPFNNILIGFKNLDLLKYQLSKHSLRRTKDLLDLPPKTIINEYLEMPDKQDSFYNNIKQGIIEEVDKVKITTTSLLAMVARLRQATACPSILTSEAIPSAKLLRAVELTEQLISNGDKVVIFSTFKETVKELAHELQEFNPFIATGDTDDSEISAYVDKFQNDPDSKVFIATWQKCGTGITLNAASYMIFIDTPWTNAVFEQACDRIHRIGTSKPVFIYNLIIRDTIDERVLELVNDKKALADYIIDDVISPDALNSLKKYISELK